MTVKRIVIKLISTLYLVTILTSNLFSQTVPDFIENIIHRDKQFSAMAGQKGIKEAYLSVLHKDGIIFRPEPVNGINYFKLLPNDIPGTLTREPVFADVSNDQTLGFTTGPYDYKGENDGVISINSGEYVSIWIKEKKKWELMLDLGIAHGKTAFTPQFTYANPMTFGMKRATLDFIAEEQQKNSMEILKATDELYCGAITNGKTETTYKEFLSSSIRLLRNNQLPILGKSPALTYLNSQYVEYSYRNSHVYVAPSRDLGYTTGTGSITTIVKNQKTTQNINYLRVWRKENSGFWRIVLDIEAPAQ
ncbi:DUF4440 domain-containing protein [Solitalea lacus]|uniref:DUF4440 domain-containing protein n=1 Tax=Solitalea lacus TaxID=2911172 RepID=UPI001EDBE9BA|nr:DUF4440 domain-containing protein [Solitalea lacus]UKJ08296.1 hypothetical protein L2B55_03775 [Solitalea lacus]